MPRSDSGSNPWFGRSWALPDTRGYSLAMTFMAVSASAQRVIASADGRMIWLDRRSPTTAARCVKFHRIKQWPVVLGVVGTTEGFEELLDWTNSLADTCSWTDLMDTVPPYVRALNHRLRQQMRESGLEPGPNDQMVSLLMTGFRRQDARILLVSDKGSAQLLTPRTVTFGLYETMADATLSMIEAMGGDAVLNTTSSMRTFMTTFSNKYPEVLAPIDVWEMTPDGGFTELLGDGEYAGGDGE